MVRPDARHDDPRSWPAWCVLEGGRDAFRVDDPAGQVGLAQLGPTTFRVTRRFVFTDAAVLEDLRARLAAERPEMLSIEVASCVERARTFPLDDAGSDLASVPRFLRWFESSYGRHTLAALIHDRLIGDAPNDGVLRSDTLSDRFFRQMMGACGVPFLKRWIMWTAVALRTRFAAGGFRRVLVLVWGLLAAAGLATAVAAVVVAVGGTGPFGLGAGVLSAVAAVAPFASSPLWGRQRGASLVAAVAVPWILPPAVLAGAGYLVYLGLERVARAAGYR